MESFNNYDKSCIDNMKIVINIAILLGWHLFGGAVRDMLSSIVPNDLDFQLTGDFRMRDKVDELKHHISGAFKMKEIYVPYNERYHCEHKRLVLTSRLDDTVSFTMISFIQRKDGIVHFYGTTISPANYIDYMDNIRTKKLTITDYAYDVLTVNKPSCFMSRKKLVQRSCKFLNAGWKLGDDVMKTLMNHGLIELEMCVPCDKCDVKIADNYAIRVINNHLVEDDGCTTTTEQIQHYHDKCYKH